MIDYSALLYDPVYAELGVDAMLTTTAGVFDLTVIDDTRPKTNPSGSAEVLHSAGPGAFAVRSVGPGAFARIPELMSKGVDRADYINSMLAFNGRMWIVRSYELRGSPNGEDLGEVRFLLKSSDD
jgi:hypothetical protein